MDVTKPHKFVGLGAMDVTKPYKFIGFACELDRLGFAQRQLPKGTQVASVVCMPDASLYVNYGPSRAHHPESI